MVDIGLTRWENDGKSLQMGLQLAYFTLFHDNQLDTGVRWSHLDVFFWATTTVGYFHGRDCNQRFPVTSMENSMKTPWATPGVSGSQGSLVRNGSMKCIKWDQLVMKIRVTGDLFYLSVQKHVCGFWFDPKIWKLCQLMFFVLFGKNVWNGESCSKSSPGEDVFVEVAGQ